MPRLPHESLPCAQCTKSVRCTPCPYSKSIFKKVSNNLRKHVVVYSFFYIFFMELMSIQLSNQKNYLTYWFPLLSMTGFFALFLNLFLLRERLKFCLRKTIVVSCLTLYYLFGIVCLVFQLPDALYTSIVNNMLLFTTFIALVLTLYTFKNER